MSDYRNNREGRGPSQGDRSRSASGSSYRRPSYGSSGSAGHQGGRRRWPMWLVVVTDVLVLGIALNAFALANSNLFAPQTGGQNLPQPSNTITHRPTPSKQPTSSSSTETQATAQNTTTQETSTPAGDQGMWGAQFADKFINGDAVLKEDSYQSRNINIKITKDENNGIEFIVADIYIRNKDNFQAFFHNDKFGGIDSTLDQANTRSAILAINGDNSANRPNRLGYEIRNGKLFHAVPWQDVLVMYNDGSMKTFDKAGFETEYPTIQQNGGSNGGVWQVWTFGPMLLGANGQAMTQFAPDSITGSGNERTAIGYYEPGHYCFVAVGSVDPSKRAGMSLADLSQKMKDLGCKAAYNLDGGRSSEMVFNGKFVNTPYQGGRSITDVICIGEYGK